MKNVFKLLFKCCLDRAIVAGDTQLQVKRKTMLIIIFSVLAWQFNFVILVFRPPGLFILFAFVFGSIVSIIVLLRLVVFRAPATDTFIEYTCYAMTLVIMSLDLHTRTKLYAPCWPYFVVLIDILLVLEVPHRGSFIVVCICVVWLLIATVETSFRFGLYDLAFLDPQEDRRLLCDCEIAPCKIEFGVSLSQLISQAGVFILDFLATRGFAVSVLLERNRIIASVDTANSIATSLSRFDLDGAEGLLDDSNIPVGLRIAFNDILKNLRSYKPYLPHSCLPAEVIDDETKESMTESSCTTVSTSLTDTLKKGRKRVFDRMGVSLLVVNICNSKLVFQHSLNSFESLITSLVAASYDIVGKHRGTLDLFIADRVFASFGATRVHLGHPSSCFDAANALVSISDTFLHPFQDLARDKLRLNLGMGSGMLTCGDLGCESMMRFSVIGKLPPLVSAIERAGQMLEFTMLGDSGLYRQLMHTVGCRVVLRGLLYEECVHLMYEFFHKKAVVDEEWMYQLQVNDVGKWTEFNSIAEALILSTDDELEEHVARIQSMHPELDNIQAPITIVS